MEALQSQSETLKEIERIDSDKSSTEEERKNSLREMNRKLTRKIAQFEATTPSLKRRVNLLEHEVKQANESRRVAEASVIEINTSLQQRILYLELWKKGAEARLNRLVRLDGLLISPLNKL